MNAPSTGARRGALAAGLTPMLDTLFLLLFALLATGRTSDEAPKSVRVDLPPVAQDAGSRELDERRRELVLEVDAASRVRRLLDGAPGPEVAGSADLDVLLARVLGEQGGALPEDVDVVLVADADARHGAIAALLSQLSLRGFVRIELLAQGQAGDLLFGADQESAR